MVGRGEYGKYEEASVAGEFPDRSKTVSGGGASDGAADASSASPGEVGAAPVDANGDARLRAAVAAWVAGSDEEGSGAAEGEGSSTVEDEGSGAGETSAAAEREGSSTGADEDADEGGNASDGGVSDGAAEGSAVDMATAVFTAARPAAATDDAKADVKAETKADVKAETKADVKADVKADGDGEGTKAAADADDAADAEDAEDETRDPRVDRATAVFQTVRPGVNGKSEAKGGAKSESKGESKSEDAAKSDATKSDADAKPDADADAKPDSDADPEPAAKAKPTPPVKSDATLTLGAKPAAKPDTASKPDTDSKPGTAAEPKADPKPDAKADADAKAGDKPKPAVEPAAEAKPEAAAKPAADKSETGLDQATAVFKAVRPGATGVDQPTTMLKLGDVPERKPGSEGKQDKQDQQDKHAKPAPKAARTAESEAERTSKFVALKPLDEPRTKPAPQTPKAPGAPGPVPAQSAAQPSAPAATPVPAPPQAAGTPAQAPPPGDRTSQQPLPPLPPLDLLAELTNTPPPPETPTRTLVRRVKIWTPLVVLLAIVFAVAQALRPLPEPKLTLTAASSHSFDGGKPSIPWPEDGQAAMDVDGIGSFGTSGSQKPVPIASIAKVMTTYLILRDHPIKKGKDGETIEVDAEAQRHYEKGKPANESVVKVTEGQKLTQYEALQAVMLPSANNVARLLARWDSKGSEDKFVAKMNKTAKELGMKNTHYTDPSGLDKTTVSTAEDLVKLGRVAMENPTFKEIAGQRSYEDINGDKQDNYFGLVPTVAIGIKTGTTSAAGGNILFAAEKRIGGKTHMVIGAALAQFGSNGVANIDLVTNVTKKLIAAGQDTLKAQTVVKKGEVVGEVDDGLGGTTPVVATKNVTAVGWSGLTVKVELEDGGETPPHSAKAGTVVGRLLVGDGTTSGAVKVPVALQKDLSEPGLGAKLTRVS